MMSILLASLLAAAAGSAPEPAKPICQDHGYRAALETPRAEPKTLAQMPPARQTLTVLRTENGCSKPVTADREIGSQQR